MRKQYTYIIQTYNKGYMVKTHKATMRIASRHIAKGESVKIIRRERERMDF